MLSWGKLYVNQQKDVTLTNKLSSLAPVNHTMAAWGRHTISRSGKVGEKSLCRQSQKTQGMMGVSTGWLVPHPPHRNHKTHCLIGPKVQTDYVDPSDRWTLSSRKLVRYEKKRKWEILYFLCDALSFHVPPALSAVRWLNAPALWNKMEGKPQIRSSLC